MWSWFSSAWIVSAGHAGSLSMCLLRSLCSQYYHWMLHSLWSRPSWCWRRHHCTHLLETRKCPVLINGLVFARLSFRLFVFLSFLDAATGQKKFSDIKDHLHYFLSKQCSVNELYLEGGLASQRPLIFTPVGRQKEKKRFWSYDQNSFRLFGAKHQVWQKSLKNEFLNENLIAARASNGSNLQIGWVLLHDTSAALHHNDALKVFFHRLPSCTGWQH